MLTGLSRPCTSKTEFFKGDEYRFCREAISLDAVLQANDDVRRNAEDVWQQDENVSSEDETTSTEEMFNTMRSSSNFVSSGDKTLDAHVDGSFDAFKTSAIVMDDTRSSSSDVASQQNSVTSRSGQYLLLGNEDVSQKSFTIPAEMSATTHAKNGGFTPVNSEEVFQTQTSENGFWNTNSNVVISKMRQMLKGLKVSSFIDDVSTSKLIPSRLSVPNLSLIEEAPSTAAEEKQNLDDTIVQTLLNGHEVSPCTSRHLSDHSLRKTSTFTSSKEIFLKTLKVRRKKFSAEDSDDDDEKKELRVRSARNESDYDLNEVVKQVFIFDNE